MSDALPRNITLIGRLKKERITGSPRRIHEILHESMRNGPFDRGSIPCGVCLKEKPPLPEALSSIGAAYRIPRIRLRGSAPASPACRRTRPRAKNAPRFLYARASTEVRIHAVATYKKSPRCRRLSISIGAAYRIRTYDVLIRSQTLYPAEVTPQRMDYYARDPSMGQATIWKNFTK